MPPTSPTNAATQPTLTQRQSCDRCHKQKLRCTRENNNNGTGNGGGCDRCLRRRVQCIYSFSLPKGRPSLYRPVDESATSTTNNSEKRSEKRRSASVSVSAVAPTADMDMKPNTNTNTNTNTNKKNSSETIHSSNPSANEHSAMDVMMDTSVDMATTTQLDTLSWEDIQLEVDWNSQDASYVDFVFASLDTFGADGSTSEAPEPTTIAPLPSPPTSFYPHTFSHGQPASGMPEKHDDSNSKYSMDRSMMDTNTIDNPLDKHMNYPSVVIGQLSQLSMRLSSLRYTSYTLAKAADSPTCNFTDGRPSPLIDAAAFEAVAAWIANEHSGDGMNSSSAHQPADSHGSGACTPDSKPQASRGILYDVFCSAHQLLEILRHLQVNNMIESYNSSPGMTPPLSSQNGSCFELTKILGSSVQQNGGQQHNDNSMQIIRHLVMACEALLLEIYVAILITLQHDAYPAASMNPTALGDVRLVLIVQLCSYLIERQHQAVDLCLSPQGSSNSMNANGPFAQKLQLSGREALSDLKSQVQQRLGHLRQMLNCS